MSDCGIRLPPEIVEMIFVYLDDEEIVSCSAENSLYVIAKRHLKRSTSLHLCRWPDTLPSNVYDACLAGDLSIKHFPGDEIKQLKTLKLWYDDPGLLPDGLLTQIFSCCNELTRLDILNVSTIEKRNIECILERCNPGLKLKINLVHDNFKSQEVLSLLEEYQELFEEIVVEFAQTKRVIGLHPIRTSKSKFRFSQSSESAILTSPGLVLLECPTFCSLKSLILEKCISLNKNALLVLSQLNLDTFSLDSYTTEGSIWISSFKTGFKNLTSFSSTNNQIITGDALEALCDRNLQSLTLDFRKGPSETVGIPHLHKLLHLVYLKIITHKVAMNELLKGIEEDYWPKLKTLEVEECSLGNDESIRKIETFKSFLASKQNFAFVHKINCSAFQDNSVTKTVER